MYTPKKKCFLFIGPLPPPRGGVSIHIYRLSNLLNDYFKIDYVDDSSKTKPEYFNFRTLSFIKYFKKILNNDLVHIHSGVRVLRYFHIIICRVLRKKIIVTYHKTPENKKSEILIESVFLNMANKVIFVNQESANLFSLKKDKFLIKEAFLPPNINDEPLLNSKILSWVKEKQEKKIKILSGNAWKLVQHQEVDLYGLDLFIELLRVLKEKNVKVCCIFTISTIDIIDKHFQHCKNLIEKYRLTDDFLLLTGLHSFPRIITKSDIIVRPTTTDGDALTIREAIWLKKPIIASNVVKRPVSTIVFKNRDISDLTTKVISVLNSNEKNLNTETENYLDFYLSLYNNV